MDWLSRFRNKLADAIDVWAGWIRGSSDRDFKCDQYTHISRGDLRTCIMEKLNLPREKVHLRDRAYACGDLESWKEWALANRPKDRKYRYNSYDCDDFTEMMRAWTHLHHMPFIVDKQAAGFAIGMVGGMLRMDDKVVGHYMLILVDDELDIWFVEPRDKELRIYSIEGMVDFDGVVINSIYM